MNANPTVEFLTEVYPKKASSQSADDGSQAYVPAVKVTWYVTEGVTQGVLESFAPLLFAAIGLTLHLRYVNGNTGSEDFGDFLGNILAIALTVVFILPSLSSKRRTRETWEVNHLVIFLFFLGLIFSLFANYKSEKPIFKFQNKSFVTFFTIIKKAYFWALFCIWFALCLPIYNLFCYHDARFRIAMSVRTADAAIFGGKGYFPFAFFVLIAPFAPLRRYFFDRKVEPNGRCFLGRPLAVETDTASNIPYDHLESVLPYASRKAIPGQIHVYKRSADVADTRGHFHQTPSNPPRFVYGLSPEEFEKERFGLYKIPRAILSLFRVLLGQAFRICYDSKKERTSQT